MHDNVTGTLETLVLALDEMPEDVDLTTLPDEVASILNYINVQCRAVVEQANDAQ